MIAHQKRRTSSEGRQRITQALMLAFLAMFTAFFVTFTLASPAYALENLQSSDPAGTENSAAGDQVASDEGNATEQLDSDGLEAQSDAGDPYTNPGSQNPDNDVDVDLSDDEMSYIYNDTTPTEENELMTGIDPIEAPEDPQIADGYEFLYIGYDKFSNYYAAFGWTEPSAGYPNEQPFKITEDMMVYVGATYDRMKKSGLVHDKGYLVNSPEGVVVVPALNDKLIPARWANLQQFILVDKNGNLISTYCADQTTEAEKGYSYNVENLDDATYYTAAEADMIRSVVLNGYWGAESGFGSLAAVKQMMTDSGKFTSEEVDSLTDGMALSATQYAVWNFSNKMHNVVFYNTYYCPSLDFYSDFSHTDDADNELIFKLYHHLINLEPSTITERTTKNTVINEKHYLNDMTITPMAKPLYHENNMDADDTNDVYIVDISFQLSVKPDPNEDDLVISLYDANNNVIAKGRIAGELQEGEKVVLIGANGIYTISGITMQEGNFVLTATLSGTQYLARDAYLFSSEAREGVTSQTLVGVAEGPYSVNVSADLEFNMEPDDSIIPVLGDEDEPNGGEDDGEGGAEGGGEGTQGDSEEPSAPSDGDEADDETTTESLPIQYAEQTQVVESSVLPATSDDASARTITNLSMLGIFAAFASALASRRATRKQK